MMNPEMMVTASHERELIIHTAYINDPTIIARRRFAALHTEGGQRLGDYRWLAGSPATLALRDAAAAVVAAHPEDLDAAALLEGLGRHTWAGTIESLLTHGITASPRLIRHYEDALMGRLAMGVWREMVDEWRRLRAA